MGRAPCCDKSNVKKGPWSPDEDAKLKSYIEQHGTGGNWIALPQKIGIIHIHITHYYSNNPIYFSPPINLFSKQINFSSHVSSFLNQASNDVARVAVSGG